MAPPLVGWCCPKGLCVSGCAFSGGQGAKDPDRQELLSTCSGTGIRLPVVRNLQSHPSSSSPVNFQVSPCPIQGPVPFPLQGHSLLLKHSTLSCLLPSLLRLSVRAEALPASPYPSIPQGPLSCHLCPHPHPATPAPRTTQLWKCFCGARSLPGLCFLSHCAQTTHLSLSSFTLSTPLGKGPYPIHLRILRPPGGRRSWKVFWKKRQTELPVRWLWVLAVVPPS